MSSRLLAGEPSWTSSPEVIDRAAWEAICSWFAHADVEVVRDGLDYALLTRHFLLDKVARAIRSEIDPNSLSAEVEWLNARQPSLLSKLSSLPQLTLIERAKQPLQTLSRLSSLIALKASSQKVPVLYVPCLHPQLKTTIATIAESPAIVVTSPHVIPKATRIRRPHKTLSKADLHYAAQLHRGILQGLCRLKVELFDQDADWLHEQILQQILDVKKIETEIATVNPNAVLVFADNHHPVQAYVLVARRAGIPSIMLQHGLDCEQYCLDEAYASVIAVWGEARLRRYQNDSTWQPDRIAVTGHPEFDPLRLPEKLSTEGKYWLWVTRPHGSEKCYTPSRTPQEGVEILDALLKALQQSPTARLLIKPHPLENLEIYQKRIANAQLDHQVELTNLSVQSLLPEASIVISEDSTAGMEAMFLGKVVVHVHFARSQPILPFVEYGAALPAYSSKMLQTALTQAQQLSAIEQAHLLAGQRHFLKDHAGLCDGQAFQRVLSLISQVLFNPSV